ncbi:3'-5' exonuclease [Caldimonas sp. KR1-144]|uniref:3'-5' exonuclease n=1 Tax=Caldimonas sp. KR1-144 TaxID=3400911 RepID=UPI003C015C17
MPRTFMMVDCETLALTPDALITQIAVGVYDRDAGQITSMLVLHPDTHEQSNRRIDYDTVSWWMKQSAPAREAVFGYTGERFKKARIREILHAFCANAEGGIWAAPSAFDFALLRDYFDACTPWSYRAERDMTTLRRLIDPDSTLEPPSDAAREHDAAYDVEWQSTYLTLLLARFDRLRGPDFRLQGLDK